jgi:hypothetical protein
VPHRTRSSGRACSPVDEQAQNHVQAGNIALSVQVMLDWLDSMDRRDSHPGLMS